MSKVKFKIEVKEHAVKQIKDIYFYYEGCAEGLGEKFLDAWETAVKYAEFNPNGFQEKYKSFRQAPIKNFPYVIMFEIDKTSVIVYSILHTSRDIKVRYKK
jgi:plasmid stabilization system protein ParE